MLWMDVRCFPLYFACYQKYKSLLITSLKPNYSPCRTFVPILGNSSLSASTLVTVHILDVNDNSPVLVGDYSWKYLCTPRWEDQALVLASRDSDGPQHGGRLNFSLRSDATVRRNWKLTPINGRESV